MPVAASNKSVADGQSKMQKGQKANSTKYRFAAFDGSDDEDDNHGGVLLRDFEHDAHTAQTRMKNKAPSNNTHVAHVRKNESSAPFAQPSTSGRRNAIAPIGTGRYSQHTSNATAGATWNTSIDPMLNAKITGNNAGYNASNQNEAVGQIGINSFTPVHHQSQVHQSQVHQSQAHQSQAHQFQAHQSQAGLKSNAFSQMRSPPTTQFGFAQAKHAQANTTTPNANGAAMQYSQSGTAMGYGWGTTPANNTGVAYNTPQTSGWGMTQGPGSSFPFMKPDTTPSHVPKKIGNNPMTTPNSMVAHNQYNQTEPRNFAPRAGGAPVYLPPPPAFNLSRDADAQKQQGFQSMGMESDPFMSPAPKAANNMTATSHALVLHSVPEDDQLALVPHPELYTQIPPEIRAVRSTMLNKMTEGPMGLPTQDIALDPDNFPFLESATQAMPVGHGVIKIRNIPFGTRRAEIIAFLGRNSKILNDNQEPVHIIMERVSSKTQDCYVEFVTMQDAVRAVERHQMNAQRGRPSRLGDRPVEVLLSSQAALMEDLFPLASGVFWDGGKPIIQAPIDGQPWKTFKGFVTEEEMAMLVKHVEIPQRSPYSKECPQRPYECMISTIKKLPWYKSDCITLRQRHAIYDATVKLIELLKQTLQRDQRFGAMQETVINKQLLKRLVTASLLCPGFSVVQKDNIASLDDMEQDRARMFNQPRFADEWKHLHALCPKPGMPLDVLEWYIAIIREETTRCIHSKPITERYEIQNISNYTSLYFGYLWYEIGLPMGRELDNLTLRQVARFEVQTIERIFRRAFPSPTLQLEGPPN